MTLSYECFFGPRITQDEIIPPHEIAREFQCPFSGHNNINMVLESQIVSNERKGFYVIWLDSSSNTPHLSRFNSPFRPRLKNGGTVITWSSASTEIIQSLLLWLDPKHGALHLRLAFVRQYFVFPFRGMISKSTYGPSAPQVTRCGDFAARSRRPNLKVKRSVQFLKKFAQYLSHRIFVHMHGTLNTVEKITNYTV